MCGIGGILSKGHQDVPTQALDKMSHALMHRGPDDSGRYLSPDGKLGLVHRRLSIIDLSVGGRQPMADSSGKVQIVLNGEIYNYKELRSQIHNIYHFRTSSDTEVILALYNTRQENFLTPLRGMFAFALWDEEKKNLLLARDRMGIKPLYYADTGHFFLFASEVRALLATGLVPRELSLDALSGYLSFGSIPTPHTIIQGINSLEPATCLQLKKGEITEKRYWNFHFGEVSPSAHGLPSLQESLQDSVASHMVSDVPVGVFLSGGIDSTAITALMRAVTRGSIRSFSITFPGSPLDEAVYARKAAELFGTEHVERPVTAQDFKRTLPDILSAMDQPTIDGVNTYFVSQLARESSLKVVLSGLGGDELFAGYRSFRMIPRLTRAYSLAEKIPLGGRLAHALLALAPRNSQTESISEFFHNGGSVEAGYFAVRKLFLEREKSKLVSSKIHETISKNFLPLSYLHGLITNGKPLHPLDATHLLEMRVYMQNQLLRDTDVMAMTHGIEARVPFLDHPLVEQIFLLPPETRLGSSPKELLLSGLAGKLPSMIYNRPKMGFTFPMDAWLREEMRLELDSFFRHPPQGKLQNAWNWPRVREIWNRFLAKRVHWSRPWSIFVLHRWVEENLA